VANRATTVSRHAVGDRERDGGRVADRAAGI